MFIELWNSSDLEFMPYTYPDTNYYDKHVFIE